MAEPNILTQAEIDSLINNIGEMEFIDISPTKQSGNSREVMNKYKTVIATRKRLEWARANESFEQIEEARRCFHHAAFSLWLINHKMNIHDFKSLLQREAKKKRDAVTF